MIKPTTINLTDKLNRKHIRMVLSKDGLWQRWVSTDRKKWKKTHESISLDRVMKEKDEVKDRNYINLFNLIFKR
jgi:hypothetical protein